VSAGARANETDIGTKVGYVAAGELLQGSFLFFPFWDIDPILISCVWQVFCTQNQVFYIKYLNLNTCSSLIPVVQGGHLGFRVELFAPLISWLGSAEYTIFEDFKISLSLSLSLSHTHTHTLCSVDRFSAQRQRTYFICLLVHGLIYMDLGG
jgi:hypothetical protein